MAAILVISKTPIQKFGLFLAIKDHLLLKTVHSLQSYKATIYSYPTQTKENGIILFVQILAPELYMYVLILIFSKWTPCYYGNGRTLASKNL